MVTGGVLNCSCGCYQTYLPPLSRHSVQSCCITGSQPSNQAAPYTMRQKDFAILASLHPLRRRRRILRLLVLADSDMTQGIHAERRLRKAQGKVFRKEYRSREIINNQFCFEGLAEEGSVRLFRFRHAHILSLVDICSCSSGITANNDYRCAPLSTTCILLQKLSFPTR